MRQNLLVTRLEVVLADDALIVSRTDPNGVITYANDDFLKYSGFSKTELLGQSHDLLRHPDMPPELFRDFWDTLREERPWNGYIKNRCKNGDHFWVHMTVSPTWKENQLTGYLSLSRKPSAEAVAAHEEVYRVIQNEERGKLTFLHGETLRKNESWWARQGLVGKLLAFFGGTTIAGLVLVAFSVFSTSTLYDSTTEIYEQGLLPAQLVGKMNKLMTSSQEQTVGALSHDPNNPGSKYHDHAISVHLDKIARNYAEMNELRDQYHALIRSSAHRDLAERFMDAEKRHMEEGVIPVMRSIQAGRYGEAQASASTRLQAAYMLAQEKSDELLRHLSDKSVGAHQLSSFNRLLFSNAPFLLLFLATVTGLLLTRRLAQTISEPLEEAAAVMRQMSQGHERNVLAVHRNDEVGKVFQSLQQLQNCIAVERVAARELREQLLAGNDAAHQDRQPAENTSTRNLDMAGHHLANVLSETTRQNANLLNLAQTQAARLRAMHTDILPLFDSAKERNVQAETIHQSVRACLQAAKVSCEVFRSAPATLTELHHAGEAIMAVIGMVENAALQTNILALNAAIEAAQAGGQEERLSTVASEVRHLAGRSTAAAQEIKALIEDSARKTEAGVHLFGDFGKTVDELLGAITDMAALMADLVKTTAAQGAEVTRLFQSIRAMDEEAHERVGMAETLTQQLLEAKAYGPRATAAGGGGPPLEPSLPASVRSTRIRRIPATLRQTYTTPLVQEPGAAQAADAPPHSPTENP